MSTTELKNKINKSLEEMDPVYLKSAHLILKELVNQQKYANIKVDKNAVDAKIAKGIQQLDNGEGTDFGIFLNEMQANYGKKK
jgi:hypothetical protein